MMYPLDEPDATPPCIARVTLDVALGKELDYRIPDHFAKSVQIGSRVKVPMGRRQSLGVVTALLHESPHQNLKPIEKVIGTSNLVTPELLSLARWMSSYYCCPLELTLKSILPEAVRKEEAGWKERLYVFAQPVSGELPKLTPRQNELWQIVEEWRELPLQELLRLAGATSDTVRRLEDKGLVRIAPQIDERDPYARDEIVPTQSLELTEDQRRALLAIIEMLPAASGSSVAGGKGLKGEKGDKSEKGKVGGGTTFLLHGVTGSGKTEIYLQAISEALLRGQSAIVLVPEISLTPQTVERFKARFSGGGQRAMVAVLHSHLSAGERHDEWHKIRQGRARIVIGARSAVFAPVASLGLIIVDEEHEHSYKQEELPRYHGRDVAVVRGHREGAVVVLGSATPSMESYYNAQRGRYRLLELPDRVTEKKLPIVRIVDLRHEKGPERGGAPGIFSRDLREAILLRLERTEQTILFLNRRGYSSSVQCPKCGHVVGCPNCSISLTHHRAANTMLCHICGHTAPTPQRCPEASCGSPQIRFVGLGTERVEDTARKLFPKARIARMDRDTLKRKEDYRRVLTEFRMGRIDILVGTQMIAKGLHFPRVTLVGVMNADLSLHIPDFRAGERTFQLLTQVSGRAGRGDVEGEVFVQSFTPFHPAIQYARRHDYQGFYEQEIEFRQQLNYPPVARVALVMVRGRSEEKVRFAAAHLRKQLEAVLGGVGDTELMGPAPAPLERAEGFHRYHLMLRTRHMTRLGVELSKVLLVERPPEGVRWTVDIDPVNLM